MAQSQLEAMLSEYCEKNRLSGVVRVTQKDHILLDASFGYADHEKKLPFTKESVFTLYSMSKPFCAIGILLLADQGLVDLDAHPGNYVPEAAGFDSRVTIRQLLQHTSGVPDFGQDTHYLECCGDVRQDLKALTTFPSHFDPGTGDRYSNIGYFVSALIIENISGLSYPEYMQKFVFAPLGMKTARIDHPGLVIPNRVQGYRLDENDQVTPCEKSYNWMLGGGDMIGTADDVYALNRAVKQKLLLKPETWEQVLTPSPINNKGFGCTVTQWHGKFRITHNGGHRGFRTLHIHLPEDDLDVIFLSNSGFHAPARTDIAEMVYGSFYQPAAAEAQPDMDTGYV